MVKDVEILWKYYRVARGAGFCETKMKRMPTDPARVRLSDPGTPEVSGVAIS